MKCVCVCMMCVYEVCMCVYEVCMCVYDVFMFVHVHVYMLWWCCGLMFCSFLFCSGLHADVPKFPFKDIQVRFRFISLTTCPEAISVMEHVRVECWKVCKLSLFHTGASKALKLEEFEQSQQQATTQVCVWLCLHERESAGV